MPDIEQVTFTGHPDDASATSYRAISAMAVASLLVGLLSVLAFWHPVLWIVPIAGVTLGLLAIARIDRRDSELLGRGLAVVAICLSLIMLSAATSRYGLLNYRARVAARELGFRWFDALRDGNPELASQLSLEPLKREPEGTDLAAFYRSEPGALDHLRKFVADPVIKAMLTLGPKARVRYVETKGHVDDGRKERLAGIYAVTYEEDGERKTFFVQLNLVRFMASPRQAAQWWVAGDALQDDPPDGLATAE